MYTISAIFLIFMYSIAIMYLPFQVGKARSRLEAGEASFSILTCALMAGSIYYIWWHHSHTGVRLILAVVLWAFYAFGAIVAVQRIHKPRAVLSSEKAAQAVFLNIVWLGMSAFLIAT